ncbi:hypothetical protein [Neobacillus sp. DY30]|nr:hypothetical protein [Neobacillus sp. DY30]WHY01568.1 hypothetical protein QNH29_04770 [Neobacillus sp. DY30]
MTNNLVHYDGSTQNNETSAANSTVNEPFTLTDEMRANISGNPYFSENNN